MVAENDGQSPNDPTEWLTEVLYTGVGLGILAINRIQVARRDFEKNHDGDLPMNPGLTAFQDLLSDPEKTKRVMERLHHELQDLDDRLDGFENRFGDVLDNLEPDLPETARELVVALRALAGDHASQIRSVLGLRSRPN